MLPLNSRRWCTFKTYFGKAADLPERIHRWQRAIGEADEKSLWHDLWEMFLHQFTITDAAYAVTPNIVAELQRVAPAERFDYLVDVGLVEAARRKEKAPRLPDDLAEEYHAAIRQARGFAISCLSLELPKEEFRYLISTLCSLHGHDVLGDMLFHQDCICGECPQCGEHVYPEEIQDSGYC